MATTINMAAYARLLSGLAPIEHEGGRAVEPEFGENYPPCNIEKLSDDRYRITVPVAGFARSQLSISVDSNQLTVRGNPVQSGNERMLYEGFVRRPFARHFRLADHVILKDAELIDGLFNIDLERPGSKPQRVAIEPVASGSEGGTRAAA